MNELKPEDVMKALECCTKGCGWCKECPIGEGERCVTRLAEAALALLREKDADIKRMYAKIDTLQKQVRQYGAEIGKKDAEIERLNAKIKIDDLAHKDLQELYDADVKSLSDHIAALIDKLQTERAEAITEFAEKLIAKKCHYTETEHTFDFDGVTVEDIEQTSKEMKEAPK